MTREASAFLAAVKWDEEAVEPRDFVRTQSLPQVAKSIKCHSSHENSDQNKVPLNQPILWLNVSRSTKIVAQPVKFRSSLPPIIYGPKVSLDHNLPGWFEILSEDGRTSSCMTSASEVAKRKPEKFLIRQKVKCLASSPGTSIVLQAGEVLTFVSSGSSNHPFLRCITQSGSPVLMPIETKGKFSQIAGPENISGVHSLLNLICGKRLPIMVRLVSPPVKTSLFREFKNLRLEQIVHEDYLTGINLMKESDEIVRLSLDSKSRLMPPSNTYFLSSLPEYKTLVYRYCTSPSSSDSGHSSPSWPSKWDQNFNLVNGKIAKYRSSCGENRSSDLDYDDVDQLYDYVRGLAPLPSAKKLDHTKITRSVGPNTQLELPKACSANEESINESFKHKLREVTRFNAGDKRNYEISPTASFTQNSAACLGRKNSNGSRSLSSPLFAIRYKSLTELPQVRSNPLENIPSIQLTSEFNKTVSKNVPSMDPFRYPKAKSRKVSRQLSLSNLLRLASAENGDLTIRSESPMKNKATRVDKHFIKTSQSKKSLGTLYM